MPIEIWGLTGQQSAFTNTSVFDKEYLEALFGGSEFPNGEFMVDYLENIMDFQKLYMEVMSDIRSENMFTFPVSTISLVRQNGEFKDKEFAEWAIKHNMKWSDSNLFIDDSVSSLSNCCRLKSDIENLKVIDWHRLVITIMEMPHSDSYMSFYHVLMR